MLINTIDGKMEYILYHNIKPRHFSLKAFKDDDLLSKKVLNSLIAAFFVVNDNALRKEEYIAALDRKQGDSMIRLESILK